MKPLFSTCAVTLAGLAMAPAMAADLPLEKIKLPKGFSISVYASDVAGARSMALGDQGTLFVGSQRAGNVYAIQDTDSDGTADKTTIVAEGLNTPNGVAFKDGALYVAEISRILKYEGIESTLDAPPEPVVLIDTLPTEEHHGWKYLDFGPDGKLYFGVGAPCDICDAVTEKRDERFSSIQRMNADGTGLETFAHGVRNTVGFTWHPTNKEMYFTDNGRDMMGDDVPQCELNRAAEPGLHFGYPFVHGGDVLDPEYGKGKNPDDYVKPIQQMGAHVAPLGLKFYTGDQFPAEYKNNAFVALHGSWNRSIKVGYKVMRVKLDDAGNAAGYEEFATGWLERQDVWGRPVDVRVAKDGALLVSDDFANVIYRIAYTG